MTGFSVRIQTSDGAHGSVSGVGPGSVLGFKSAHGRRQTCSQRCVKVVGKDALQPDVP